MKGGQVATEQPDPMGARLSKLEEDINHFKVLITGPQGAFFAANPHIAASEFAKTTVSILSQQHQLLVLLESRLAELERLNP